MRTLVAHGLDDDELSGRLQKTISAVLLCRAYRFLLAIEQPDGTSICSGELGKKTTAALAKLSKANRVTTQIWPDCLEDRPTSVDIALFSGGSQLGIKVLIFTQN